jgi:hypothetical protein
MTAFVHIHTDLLAAGVAGFGSMRLSASTVRAATTANQISLAERCLR